MNDDIRKAIAANPKAATVWGNLGWTQFGMGKYEEAIISSHKALELDSKLAYVKFNLGLIYAVQNDWEKAKA